MKDTDPAQGTNKLGLSSVSLNPLDDIDIDFPGMKLALSLDCLWIITFALENFSPSWSEFMQTIGRSGKHAKSIVGILPFIHLYPSNLSTIYNALSLGKKQCELHNINTCFVCFDRLLH